MLAAIRSSRIFRVVDSAMAACLAFSFGAVRMSAFFTYCWASVDPPWTDSLLASLTMARRVPRGSMAPCR